jgi:serine/threonine-protein kinase
MRSDDRIADRYVPKKRLGRGGMGEVWLAHDARLERDVALKLLFSRYAADPDFLVRFFSEAQSVAGLNHPHVVPVLDFGHGPESPFLVMEFVEGGSLAGLLSRPFTPERAFEIVADAARGAGAAHSQGVVHRDVKPGNILLTEEGLARLADFGIASTANAEVLTEPGAAMGSPYYISPEQAAGKRASPSSDV